MSAIQLAAEKHRAIEKTLTEIAKVEETLTGLNSKFDDKINKLKSEKVKKTQSIESQLIHFQKDLLKLVESYEFPKDTKTLKFEIGDIFKKKLPDTLDIPDEEKTITKLEQKGLTTCVKTVKTVIKKACEALDVKIQKACGITIKEGEDRIYYKINKFKTSTGLVFPE